MTPAMPSPQHFLEIAELDQMRLAGILANARAMKDARRGRPRGEADRGRPLAGQVLAMLFEQPSTRTRVSFDVAMRQMGGEALFLSAHDLQLGRGETIADTARVLSRYVDGIVLRAAAHQHLVELAAEATVPVINGLTDLSHPCQVMADLMTLEEKKGRLAGLTVAWSGDSCNVTNSWIEAAGKFDFAMRVASPRSLQPRAEVLEWARSNGVDLVVTDDAHAAVKGADCVMTDTWVSMNVTDSTNRHNLLKPYQVNRSLLAEAKPDAVFMHCLPAHRGEEVTAEVIDGPQSVVLDEAENRLHIQKSILAFCLAGRPAGK
ncbi:MAG TPA: ornithine carbamoyltransferase [Aestuariivirgaceae bacterium]|nr:ornithine carbamoyltransferase [Aestuariivirgaceae bacterium]